MPTPTAPPENPVLAALNKAMRDLALARFELVGDEIFELVAQIANEMEVPKDLFENETMNKFLGQLLPTMYATGFVGAVMVGKDIQTICQRVVGTKEDLQKLPG